MGIPLLYPWANRLGSLQYRAAGSEVLLDSSSPRLHFDDHKLPMHGVPWSELQWNVVSSHADALTGRLDWLSQKLLAIFPFPHHVEMAVRLRPVDLEIQTTDFADSGSPVPISFGFHPYFGLPGIPRAEWTLNAPAMRKLAVNAQGIPTGQETLSTPLAARLGNTGYDDGFALSGMLRRGSACDCARRAVYRLIPNPGLPPRMIGVWGSWRSPAKSQQGACI